MMIMGTNIILIKTKQDLESCEPGQVIEENGRIGVYAGMAPWASCSCPCGGSIGEYPMVVFSKGDKIFTELVLSRDEPKPRKITRISIVKEIPTSDARFDQLSKYLRERGVLDYES